MAAILALLRRIGARRKVEGRIAGLRYYPELRALEGKIDIPKGWPGYQAGQSAFLSGDPADGWHPYAIASSWDPAESTG